MLLSIELHCSKPLLSVDQNHAFIILKRIVQTISFTHLVEHTEDENSYVIVARLAHVDTLHHIPPPRPMIGTIKRDRSSFILDHHLSYFIQDLNVWVGQRRGYLVRHHTSPTCTQVTVDPSGIRSSVLFIAGF